jgi:predicted TIM-barrel fold metal-dependent hydrolase
MNSPLAAFKLRAPRKCTVSRRDVLKTFAAALPLGALPAGALLAQEVNRKSAAKRGRIDVHSHMSSPSNPRSGSTRNWTPEKAIADMEKNDIATAIVMPVNAIREDLWTGTEKARGLVRNNNEYGAKLVRDYPGRFGLYAALPFIDVEGSLKEIGYAYDVLKTDGIGLWPDTGADKKWLGHTAFAPIFDELNRRKAVVFIHANTPACCHDLDPGVPDSMSEYDFDITRAVTSLLINGTLSRCPDIKFIIAHSGATIPMLAGRIKDRVPKVAQARIPNGTYYELRKLYYEIAHASFPWSMAALLKFAPVPQILFGTDYPIERIESTIDELPASNLSPETLRAIDRENAERLFPRFKA